MLASQKTVWRNRSNVRIIERFMGFYESQKEILARSDYYDVAFIGSVDSAIAGFGSSAIYLYAILKITNVYFGNIGVLP